jgi:hypothetical protein
MIDRMITRTVCATLQSLCLAHYISNVALAVKICSHSEVDLIPPPSCPRYSKLTQEDILNLVAVCSH